MRFPFAKRGFDSHNAVLSHHDMPRQYIGFAQKLGRKQVRGAMIQLASRTDGADFASGENSHAIGKRKSLSLIVRDVNKCYIASRVKLSDFVAHLYSQPGVEIGKRFVEQDDSRI